MISGFKSGASAAVMGCGSIGLLMIQTLLYFGASKVTGFDISEDKLYLSKEYGAEYAVNTGGDWIHKANEITNRKLYDFVFEAGGVEFTEKASILLAGAQATVVFVGTPFSDICFTAREFEEINRRELWLKGVWQSYSTPFPGKEWELTAHYFATDQLRFDNEMIYKTYPMAQAAEAFALYKNPSQVHGKIMLINNN